MSEAPGKIILHCNKDGKWDRLPIANGCSASTEPLVPDVTNTEEFRRAADFRKGLLNMPILGIDKTLSSKRACKKWLRQNTLYNPARQNYATYHHGLPLPWRVERYYARYNRYRPVRGRIVLRKPRSKHKPIIWPAADYRFLKKHGI